MQVSSLYFTDCLLPAVAIILQDKNSIEKSQFAEETLLKCEEQFQKQMYFFFIMWDSKDKTAIKMAVKCVVCIWEVLLYASGKYILFLWVLYCKQHPGFIGI